MRKYFKQLASSTRSFTDCQSFLRFEELEDRRMLAAAADIVFLMDLSESNSDSGAYNWLKDEVFRNESGQPNPIVEALSIKGIPEANIRYGLVGFGASGETSEGRAHSYIVDSNATNPLFGTASQIDAAFDKMAFGIQGEDG